MPVLRECLRIKSHREAIPEKEARHGLSERKREKGKGIRGVREEEKWKRREGGGEGQKEAKRNCIDRVLSYQSHHDAILREGEQAQSQGGEEREG